MDRARLSTTLAQLGEPPYRATQALQAMASGAADWGQVTSWPKGLRDRVADALPFWEAEVAEREVSADGTVKWVLRAPDAAVYEAVLIAHEEGRRTLCVSSQAGCALACRFCATGALGPGRDLTAVEIVDQARRAAREAEDQGGRLSNVVFMGMGEPMQNLDAVMAACSELNAPEDLGIGARRIAISTVGWVPGISRLASFELPVRLAVSLHAADDATRSELMPVNARWPIANLMAACRRYCDRTGRRIFIEYLLMEGVNDDPGDARKLAELLTDGRYHVNLIEYNPTAGPYRASSPQRRLAFAEALRRAHIGVSIRRSHGQDIAAACGQLAGTGSAADAR
jgi:23S rRNA (adenine2503-C2)-methyltransferase